MDNELKQMEKVQRIIALKRFEQPPPGYFHLLPGRIINRIEKGEGRSSAWENWFSSFNLRPAWACAFGLGVCSVATLGMFFPRQAGLATAGSPMLASSFDPISSPLAEAPSTDFTTTLAHPATWLGGSTDPVISQQSTAFAFETRQDSSEGSVTPISLSIGN